MVLQKEWFGTIPAILLVGAIGFSASFSAGRLPDGKVIEIRAEDILLVVLGLVWIANFFITKRRSIERPPLFLPIIAWLSVVCISTLTNLLFGDIELKRGFFYTLKEIEFFFIYFYLFYHLRSRQAVQWMMKLWIAIAVVEIAWILFQIVFGLKITYYYSYTTLIEPEGSSPGGGFLLLIFVFLLNVFLYHYVRANIPLLQKGLLAVATFLPVVGIWTSGSRVVLLGFIGAIFFTAFLYARKSHLMPVFLGLIALAIIGGGLLLWQISIEPPSFLVGRDGETYRLADIKTILREINPENPNSRVSIWTGTITELSKQPLLLFLGRGKSAQLEGGQSHNYYLQVLTETGIVGSFLFFILILSIIKIAWQGFAKSKDSFTIGLSAGLLTATVAILLLSMYQESFQVVKIAEVYWVFTAITMAGMRLSNASPERKP